MNQSYYINTINWTFGFIVLILGTMNIIRGNDPILGVALLLASFIYFPPSYHLIRKVSTISIHHMIRIVIALLIIWVNMAVGAISEGYYPELTN